MSDRSAAVGPANWTRGGRGHREHWAGRPDALWFALFARIVAGEHPKPTGTQAYDPLQGGGSKFGAR
jgi:hypothetical protein